MPRSRRPLADRARPRQAFQITSDEAPTWDQIYRATARAAGVPEPKLIHIATDFIVSCLPEMEGTLRGDKSGTALFDNSKLRSFVPDFKPATPFSTGIARSIAWFDADPRRKLIDDEANAKSGQVDRRLPARPRTRPPRILLRKAQTGVCLCRPRTNVRSSRRAVSRAAIPRSIPRSRFARERVQRSFFSSIT